MAIGLSANTPVYSSTPAPLGRPGGPGLWRTKNLKLPDYIEQIATGILKGGEPDKSRAIALAVAAVKRWASGGGKVSPEVRAAAAKALAEWTALKASHSHANEDGAAVSLSWNGQHVDLASVELGSYIAPHLPAGTPQGGQFGTTSGGGAPAGKTSGSAKAAAQARTAGLAKRAALHAQANALRAQAKTLQAQITALNATIALQVKATAAAAAKPKASATAKAAAAIKKAATKAAPAKTPAKPKKPTLAANRASVASLKTQVSSLLSRAAALDRQAAAVKLANGGGMDFLELAVADALAVPDPALRRQVLLPAERVPPGVPEGGQYAPKAGVLTSHDTPEQAAAVINGMGPRQRAAVRASTLPPPGFAWGPNDRLTTAELGEPYDSVLPRAVAGMGRQDEADNRVGAVIVDDLRLLPDATVEVRLHLECPRLSGFPFPARRAGEPRACQHQPGSRAGYV